MTYPSIGNFPALFTTSLTTTIIVGLLMSSCVSASTHEKTVDELAQSNVDLEQSEASNVTLRTLLDKITDERDQLTRALAWSDTNRDAMLARIAELDILEAEIQAQNDVYRAMLERFQSLIDAGQLSVSIERGRIVIKMPQDVLFDSGNAMLRDDGRVALAVVGAALSEFSERTFQVEGHTDNEPISNQKFSSNWELSSTRALSVVHYLIEAGVVPSNLSAAGFGEFQPSATNTTKAGQQLNRRIEIIMVPNLDVLFESAYYKM